MSGLTLSVVVACVFAGVLASAPEKELAKTLMEQYEQIGIAGRPVTDVQDAVDVKVGLTPFKLLKLDKGYLTLSSLMELEWNDPFLAWEPSKYDGADRVALPADAIWRPDFTVWNDFHQSASDQEEDMEDADVLVMNDGKVIWIPKMTFKVPCSADEDGDGDVTCSLITGSWVHSSDKIKVHLDEGDSEGVDAVDTEMIDPTPGLELVSASAEMVDNEYPCCPGEKYTIVTFKLDVKKTSHCDAKNGSCN